MKKTTKKLRLEKHTLRALATGELTLANGGQRPDRLPISLPICTSPDGGCV